jgi:hypothetical protein
MADFDVLKRWFICQNTLAESISIAGIANFLGCRVYWLPLAILLFCVHASLRAAKVIGDNLPNRIHAVKGIGVT